MRVHPTSIRPYWLILVTASLFLLITIAAGAQSQEPKPTPPGTPIAEPDVPALATPVSGVSDSSWQGPNFGLAVSWDPAIWTVEGELIDAGYDGLQIGTPASTVFVEAYEGFGGDAEACLVDAEREITERESVSEVAPLTGRTMPNTGSQDSPAALFGVLATLPDGTPYRGLEYVECRSIVPDSAVLEITWQTATTAYNQELPLVEALLATLELPGEQSSPDEPPSLPSAPPLTEPNTARSQRSASLPESASAK